MFGAATGSAADARVSAGRMRCAYFRAPTGWLVFRSFACAGLGPAGGDDTPATRGSWILEGEEESIDGADIALVRVIRRCFPARNWSGRRGLTIDARGHPGLALGEHHEGVEEVPAVFGGRGEVAADRAELRGSSEGA
jgi:hypothetical protein